MSHEDGLFKWILSDVDEDRLRLKLAICQRSVIQDDFRDRLVARYDVILVVFLLRIEDVVKSTGETLLDCR